MRGYFRTVNFKQIIFRLFLVFSEVNFELPGNSAFSDKLQSVDKFESNSQVLIKKVLQRPRSRILQDPKIPIPLQVYKLCLFTGLPRLKANLLSLLSSIKFGELQISSMYKLKVSEMFRFQFTLNNLKLRTILVLLKERFSSFPYRCSACRGDLSTERGSQGSRH